MHYFLDTNICIYYLKGLYPSLLDRMLIHSVSEIISFDDKMAEIYAQIKADTANKGNPIGPNDLIIAAIVLANSGILITNNESEFSRIDSLEIENWTK